MLKCVFLAMPLLVMGAAMAQTASPSVPPTAPMPERPPSASTSTPPAEKIAPGGEHGTLSDRLSQNRGTVSPPAVDSGMAVKPPASTAGAMPVIPPPGSKGGDPKVVPK